MKLFIRLITSVFVVFTFANIANKLGVPALIDSVNAGVVPSPLLMLFLVSITIPAAILVFIKEQIKYNYAGATSAAFILCWMIFLAIK